MHVPHPRLAIFHSPSRFSLNAAAHHHLCEVLPGQPTPLGRGRYSLSCSLTVSCAYNPNSYIYWMPLHGRPLSYNVQFLQHPVKKPISLFNRWGNKFTKVRSRIQGQIARQVARPLIQTTFVFDSHTNGFKQQEWWHRGGQVGRIPFLSVYILDFCITVFWVKVSTAKINWKQITDSTLCCLLHSL